MRSHAPLLHLTRCFVLVGPLHLVLLPISLSLPPLSLSPSPSPSLSLPPPLSLSLPPPLPLSLSLSLSLSLPPSGALCAFLREKDGHLAVMAFSFPQLSHINSNTHIHTHSLVLPVARCPSARHLFQNAPSSQPSVLSALPCVHLSLLSPNHQKETLVSLLPSTDPGVFS
ncbi:unnamed protein product [Gadus morhua 'NCC']